MAYSSKSDAINKLTNGLIDNASLVIYTSDNNFDNNTIFYSNSAKTILLPQGNYVYPTNYRSLWIQIGSNGKFSASPEYLITNDTDASFVNDTVYSRQAQTRVKIGGTDMSMTNNKITDANWANLFPFATNKQWVVNMAARNTTAITDVDLSAMEGKDMLFFVGAYDQYNRFEGNFNCTFFAHIKQDINKQTVFTDGIHQKIYFLKPDYWYSKDTINRTTFFKRNPSVLKIKNKRGTDKLNIYNDFYILDILQTDKQTARTSTRKDRGLHIDNWISSTFNNTAGGYNTSVSTQVTIGNACYVDVPNFLRGNFFSLIYGHSYNPDSQTDQYRLSATFRSMFLEDFTGVYQGILYEDANPYHWTCAVNSGTGFLSDNPANAIVSFLSDTSGYNTKVWYWDMELFYYFNIDDTSVNGLFKCLKNAKDYVVANSLSSVDTKVVWYSGGVYASDGNFDDPYGQPYTTANYTSSKYYLDFHNYYIGSSNKSTLSDYWLPFYNYGEYFLQSYISNYQFGYNNTTHFYKMCMQYDISNKLMTERLGANHSVAFASSNQDFYETVAGSSLGPFRKAINSAGNPSLAKPDITPDFLQSLAAWSFGYCDGALTFGTSQWLKEDYSGQTWDETWGNPELLFNTFASGHDWYYATMFNLFQNKDIIEETTTSWQYTSQLKSGGGYTTGTENYPITNWVYQRPLIAHKFNSTGTEALILALNPFNNGYTKSTVTVDLYGGYPMTIDMYGNYTTVMRVKVSAIPPSP